MNVDKNQKNSVVKSASVSQFDHVLTAVKPLIDQYLSECDDADANVCHALSPDQLKQMLQLDLPSHGKGATGLVESLEKIFQFSIKTWSPKFMDKLFTGADAVGCIGELIGALLNTNCHVYSVSPVFTLMEQKIMREMAQTVGWNKGGGALCPGGSYSNLLAIFTARNHFFPEIQQFGSLNHDQIPDLGSFKSTYRYNQHRGPLVIFTSVHSHYSVLKSGLIAGIGDYNIRTIPTDAQGRMRTSVLAAEITESLKRKERPFFVNATAGTTVLGAFDPLAEIAKICDDFGLWMHVDGSWGGAVMFHPDHGKTLLNGLELADSFTMNPHKVLGIPLLCSAFMLKNPILLEKNRVKASYLFHQVPGESESQEESYDIGAGLLGCGRRPNILKLYLSWQYHGSVQFAAQVQQGFDLAEFFTGLIKNQKFDENATFFETVLDSEKPQYYNICFWAYPPLSAAARELLVAHVGKEVASQSHPEVFRKLKEKNFELFHALMETTTKAMHYLLHSRGKFMVDYAPVELPAIDGTMQKLPAFWRLVVHHPRLSAPLLASLFDHLLQIGNEIDVRDTIKMHGQ